MEYWDFLWTSFHAAGRFIGVLAVLMVIVLVHEMGHYLVGRCCGIKSVVFSIGFGPELWARTDRRGTRWRLAALPLGGYVRFLGDESADSVIKEVKNKASLPRGSFAAANAWARAATVFAGPFFNAVLAIVILSFMAFHFGKYTLSPVVSQILPDSPASASGLAPGDRFLTMEGAAVKNFADISAYVMTHEDEPIHFTVERQGKPLALTITPKAERADDGFGNIIRIGRIGVMGANNPENIGRKTYNLRGAVGEGFRDTGMIISQTGRYLGKLLHGRGDRCQLSGPVRTAQIAWQVSNAGIWALVQLAAFLSIGIGIFNLLPLPPLDGGHLLFYLTEGLTGFAVPARAQEMVFRGGWVVIILFTVFAILNNFLPC